MEQDNEFVPLAKQAKTSSSCHSASSTTEKSEYFKNELSADFKPSTSKTKTIAELNLEESTKTGTSKAKCTSKLNALLVNPKQKGNPLLKFVTSVPWEYGDIVPDYVMGRGVCALFLSLRYHQLNPDYIHDRLKLLSNAYDLRVLLVQVDIMDPQHVLKHLTRVCILADLTMMLAWNAEDAGRIIETYKIYENKPPDMIMERSDAAPHQKITNALTTVRSVNKTDAMNLLSTFGTLENIVKSTQTTLAVCPGFGSNKAQRFYKTLHQPFLRDRNKKSIKSIQSKSESGPSTTLNLNK